MQRPAASATLIFKYFRTATGSPFSLFQAESNLGPLEHSFYHPHGEHPPPRRVRVALEPDTVSACGQAVAVLTFVPHVRLLGNCLAQRNVQPANTVWIFSHGLNQSYNYYF